MRQLRPWLYIGTRRDVRNPALLGVNRITAMLQLATAAHHLGIASHCLAVSTTIWNGTIRASGTT